MPAQLSATPLVSVLVVAMVAMMLVWTLQSWLRQRTPAARTASRVYGSIVTQSRSPQFYGAYGVPDTMEGRFSVLALHLYVVADRLRGEGPSGAALAQALIEAFITDMDDTMREIGIGDLSVPGKVKTAAGALYTRMRSYDAARAAPQADDLARAIGADLAASGPAPDAAAVARLADYVRASLDRLATQPLADILEGRIGFAPLAAAVPQGERA